MPGYTRLINAFAEEISRRVVQPELERLEYYTRTYAEWVSGNFPRPSGGYFPGGVSPVPAAAEPAAAAAAEPAAASDAESHDYAPDEPEYVPESPVLLAPAAPAAAASAAAAAYPDPFHPGADPTEMDNGLPKFVQSAFFHRGEVPCMQAAGCEVCRRVLAEQDEAVASKMQAELDAEDGVQPAAPKRRRRVRFAPDSRVIVPDAPAVEPPPPSYAESVAAAPPPPAFDEADAAQLARAHRRASRYGHDRLAKRKSDAIDLTEDDE